MQERAQFYADALGSKWPASVPTVGADGRLQGIWLLGNDYRNKTLYHGAHPPNYLTRADALFPDAERTLHLFSGSLPSGNYTRFDMREDVPCEVRGDAHKLASHFPNQRFDLIHADPPYTAEDAAAYGTPMVNRNTVVREVYKILEPGGYLVWLDMVLPMYRKVELELAGVVGIVRSTNHRFRCVAIFKRL
jgi:hypothetical protein